MFAISHMLLSTISWREAQEAFLDGREKKLEHLATLVYCDESILVCVHTHASDVVWSGAATQMARRSN